MDRLADWEPGRWPVAEGWHKVIHDFLHSHEGRALSVFMQQRLAAGAMVYPPTPFRALELTGPGEIHAVILGQDPYHGPGQAHGLAFSVQDGVKLPPSLRNIFKELGGDGPRNGSLEHWARRGVLLLNTCLTVEQGQPGSHARKGWEALTDALLAEVARTASPCVYFLWGAHAQAKRELIQETAHENDREVLILASNHPSPLSAARPPVPFLGSGCFRQAREWLAERGIRGVF